MTLNDIKSKLEKLYKNVNNNTTTDLDNLEKQLLSNGSLLFSLDEQEIRLYQTLKLQIEYLRFRKMKQHKSSNRINDFLNDDDTDWASE